MSDRAEQLLPFGPLEVSEVYTYYEFPRFYSLKSVLYPEVRVLVLCTADDEEEATADFLYVAMTTGRLAAVTSGQVPLREAFEQAESGQLWRVGWKFDGDRIEVDARTTLSRELKEAELPKVGARMSRKTATAPAFDVNRDLVMRARESNQTVAAIELATADSKRTEFPMKALGAIQLHLQSVLDSIGQEKTHSKVSSRGAVPREITKLTQMSVVPMTLAASYVFLITPDLQASGLLFEDDLVQDSLGDLHSLLQACIGGDVEKVQETFKARAPRTRGRFKELLSSVKTASSSIGLISAGPGTNAAIAAHVSANDVRLALAAIEDLEPHEREIIVARGVLWGLDAKSGTFRLSDLATGKEYRGGSPSELKAKWSSVAVGSESTVGAVLLKSQAVERADDVEPSTYTLLALTARDDSRNLVTPSADEDVAKSEGN